MTGDYGNWGSEWPPEVYYRMIRQRGQGGGGSSAIDPSVTSPFIWYDPSDLSTLFQDAAMTIPVTANNDPVGAMLDKSGNGFHVTQATANARPLYKTSGGLHWLESDGIDDFLSVVYANVAQPYEALTAIRNLGALAAANGHFVSGPGFNAALYAVQTSLEIRSYAGSELSSGATATVGTDIVATQRFDGASSRIAIDNEAYVDGNAGGNDTTGLTLFAASVGDQQFTQARFAGRLQHSRFLSDAEVALLRTYLAEKQGRIL